MPVAHRSGRDLIVATKAFNTAAATVGSLYLATNSVTVTAIGAAAATATTAWAIWLHHRRDQVRQEKTQLNGGTGA
jgi:hypothetical protein